MCLLSMSRCGELQLSANRSTRYHPNSSEVKSDILRYVSPLSSLTHHGVVPCFGELDVVGVVFRIGPAPQTSENTTHFQTAYLSDSEQNIIGVSFWEGIKASLQLILSASNVVTSKIN